jgi:hypothetical protein
MLRRHVFSSTDYRVLSGVQEARDISVASGGWLAARAPRRGRSAPIAA